MKKTLLLCEGLPQMGSAGNLSYLYAFLDYMDSRRFDTTIVLVGYRVPKLWFRLSDYIPFHSVRVVGDGLLCFGDWILILKFGAWRRAAHRWLSSAKWTFVRAFADRLYRMRVKESKAVMGHFAGPADVASSRRFITRANADFIIIDSIFLSAFRDAAPRGTRSIIVTHDVFYQRYESFFSRNLAVIPAITPELESSALKDFDTIIAISSEDANAFSAIAPHAHIVVFPSPIYLAPTTEARGTSQLQKKSILFIGSRSSHNVDGLLWFLQKVWPEAKQRHPSVTMDVVGSVCEEIKGEYDGVLKHYVVKDLSVVAKLATFAINPVRAGSGLKIKMLDYLSYELPFITSSLGISGFPRSGEEPFIVCDDAAGFFRAVDLLLSDQETLRALSGRCAPYAKHFSRDFLFARLDAAFS